MKAKRSMLLIERDSDTRLSPRIKPDCATKPRWFDKNGFFRTLRAENDAFAIDNPSSAMLKKVCHAKPTAILWMFFHPDLISYNPVPLLPGRPDCL